LLLRIAGCRMLAPDEYFEEIIVRDCRCV